MQLLVSESLLLAARTLRDRRILTAHLSGLWIVVSLVVGPWMLVQQQLPGCSDVAVAAMSAAGQTSVPVGDTAIKESSTRNSLVVSRLDVAGGKPCPFDTIERSGGDDSSPLRRAAGLSAPTLFSLGIALRL